MSKKEIRPLCANDFCASLFLVRLVSIIRCFLPPFLLQCPSRGRRENRHHGTRRYTRRRCVLLSGYGSYIPTRDSLCRQFERGRRPMCCVDLFCFLRFPVRSPNRRLGRIPHPGSSLHHNTRQRFALGSRQGVGRKIFAIAGLP